MSMKGIVFNLKYRCLRPKTFSFHHALQKSQFQSSGEREEVRQSKTRGLVRTAFMSTQFYREHYSSVGFEVGDVEQPGFWDKLPIVTKDHLRNRFEGFVHSELKQHLATSTTGGSTGVPVKCGYDKRYLTEAFSWRTLSWWGLYPWDDGGYVWRNPRTTLRSQLLNQALWWPTRKIRLDASSMTPESMTGFVSQWNKIKPPQLQGYVGAVVELAQFIEANAICFHKPRVVWVTSAPLSSVQRSLLERVFGTPVYDQYGCCEVSWIAAQCERKGGLHVNAERVGLEYVDENNCAVPEGEWGRTLITRYDDFVFPLIRYEVGDTGRFLKQSCACGRTLPLIDQVKGRTTDMIRLPSGRVLSGDYLTTIFDACPDAVQGFRVIQRKDDSIVVEYVPEHNQEYQCVVKKAEQILKDKVNQEVPVCFQAVPEIAHDRGKLRFVISEKQTK